MTRRRSIPVFALAVVLAVSVPLSRLALARVSATVTCCCGTHDAGEACGCPVCPSGIERAGDPGGEPSRPAITTMRSCQTSYELGAPPADAPFVMPDRLDLPAGERLSIPGAADPDPDQPAYDPPPRPS